MPSLKPEQLARELDKGGPLRPVYFFAGEETFRKFSALSAIKKLAAADDFNYFEADADKAAPGEFVTLACTPPAFSSTRLVVMRRAEKMTADERRSLCSYLENPVETTCLVIMTDERKLRDESVAKACEKAGVKVIFYALWEQDAEQWVLQRAAELGLQMSPSAGRLLVSTAGTDLSALDLELEKIFCYVGGKPKTAVTDRHVLDCLGFAKEENPYDFGKTLLQGDMARASTMIDKLLDSGEQPILLLNILTDTLIKVIRVRRLAGAGIPGERVFAAAGLHAFFDRDFMQYSSRFQNAALLLPILAKALETDAQLKSSTDEDPRTLLKSLAMRFTSARSAGR